MTTSSSALLCILFVAVFHIGQISCLPETSIHENSTNLVDTIWHTLNYTLNPSASTLNPKRISAKCYEDLQYMVDVNGYRHSSYSKTPNWQRQMLDAYALLPGGQLEGNILWMGEFKQCTLVEVWKNTKTEENRPPDFKGKYCLHNPLLNIIGPLPRHMKIEIPAIFGNGLCFPSSCSSKDVETLVNEYTYPIKTTVNDELCRTNDPKQPDLVTILMFIPFVLFGAVLGVASIYDVTLIIKKKLRQRKEIGTIENPHEKLGRGMQILLCFSVLTNTKRLMDTSHRNEHFACINGLRAISMFYVVGCHALLMFPGSIGTHNPIYLFELIQKLYAQPFVYATNTVDTFFCLTGFLVTHTILYQGTKIKRFNVLAFYVHRFWRLTPSLLLTFIFSMGPYQLFGDGPIWSTMPFFREKNCRKTIWHTPLYIGVYYDPMKEPMCLPHTWYLDAEIALYLATPIVLYPMFKQHWSALYVWVASFSTLITYVTITAYMNKLQNIFTLYAKAVHIGDNLTDLYMKPWGRGHAFLVGMLFGYYYYHKGKNFKLNRKLASVIWFFVATSMLACIFINYPYTVSIDKTPPSRLYYTFYIPISQSLWAFSVGTIIFLSATGYGGVVNKILSWKLFAPIGRLSFCAYLIHLNILGFFMGTKRHSMYYDFKFLAMSSLTANIITLFAAYVLCMMVESPSVAIEGILLKPVLSRFEKLNKKQKQEGNNTTKYSMLPEKDTAESIT